MTLTEYLDATEYAARSLLDAIWHEQAEIDALSARVAALERRVEAEYATARTIIDDAETPDDVMLGVGRHWENYFGPDRERHGQQQHELEGLRAAREARASALGALAGNLLQVAKQGLSTAFGEEANWPDGRPVGSQSLKTVIRGARNQTIHWEEGQCRTATVQVFERLAQDFGAPFGEYNTTNLAMPVITLLGWRTYDDYVADMRRFDTGAINHGNAQ